MIFFFATQAELVEWLTRPGIKFIRIFGQRSEYCSALLISQTQL